jgi:hypothetical protein
MPGCPFFFRRVIACFLALVFARPVVATAQSSGPTGTARVTVLLVADDDGVPVKRTSVSLQGTIFTPRQSGAPAGEPERVRRDGVTNDAGRVTFASLPEAAAYLVITRPQAGFVTPTHLESFAVKAGEAVTRVVRLARTGAIAGRVIDESGEPLVRVSVRALQKESGNGRPGLAGLGDGGRTDERGEFRIFGLPPGRYYLLAISPIGGLVPPSGRDAGAGYVPTLYPEASTVDRAALVVVMPGRDTAVPDFTLLNGDVSRVTVRALAAAGVPLTSQAGRVSLVPQRRELSEAVRGGILGRDGSFTIDGVPPGDYYLIAWNLPPGGEEEGVVVPVSVGNGESSIEVKTNRGATLSGRIVREGPEVPGGPGRLLTLPAPGGMTTIPTAIHRRADVESRDDSGAFRITGARGAVVLVWSGPGLLRSVRSGGREMLGVPFTLSGSERIDDLEVVVTTDVGGVSGRVTDANGEAVEADVFAFPENPRAWSSLFARSARSAAPGAAARTGTPGLQSDVLPGQFRFFPLAPGRYLVAARRTGPGGTAAPDTDLLAQIAPSATLVTVAAGETVSVDLKVR